jgi:serine/threonine protein kinase
MGTIHHESDVYLITEYMEGGTLWKLLNNKAKPLPWLTRVNIAIDVARAITYLHARNIIHRDLKCRNLLIDRNIRVKVCDFGLCREANPEQQKFMTKSGTDEWMAPEVILGNPYNAKADSFSFGMVLFEIITREKPPSRDPMRGFELDPAEISAALPADCPPELRVMTLDCIKSDQNARPGFKEIMDRLFKLRDRLKPPKKPKEGADFSSLPPNFSTHHSPEILPPPEPLTLPPITPRTEAALLSALPPPPDPSTSAKRPPSAKRVFKKTVTELPDPGVATNSPPTAMAPPPLDFPPNLPQMGVPESPLDTEKSSKRERRKSAKLTSSDLIAHASTPDLPPPMGALSSSLNLPPPPVDEQQKDKKRKSEKRKDKKDVERAVSPPPVMHPPPMHPPPISSSLPQPLPNAPAPVSTPSNLPPPSMSVPQQHPPVMHSIPPPQAMAPPVMPTSSPPPPAAAAPVPVIPKLPALANIPVVGAPRTVAASPAVTPHNAASAAVPPTVPISQQPHQPSSTPTGASLPPPPPAMIPPPTLVPPPFPPPL